MDKMDVDTATEDHREHKRQRFEEKEDAGQIRKRLRFAE
jgi:hypothetical protein